MKVRHSKAFTLIELLIVVVIIGILAGIVLAVLNPAQQQLRARQGVFQSNMNKVCTALYACAASTTNVAYCSGANSAATHAAIGAQDPTGTPPTSTYVASVQGGNTVQIIGTFGTCTRTCSYNFTNSTVAAGTYTGCIVGE